MFLDHPPFLYFWRPVYHKFVVPVAYPALSRMGITVKTGLSSTEDIPVTQERAALQWEQIEPLLLTLLAQPQTSLESERLQRIQEQQEELLRRVQTLEASMDRLSRLMAGNSEQQQANSGRSLSRRGSSL